MVNNEYVIVHNSENLHDTLSRIQRERNPPTKLKDYFTFISEGDVEDPLTIEKALSALDSLKWKEAINEKLDSIIKNDVWELVELSKNRKAIGSKWILKRKFECDGSIEKYKTRLVAKGFTQKPGIDYEKTYSPVAKFTSIRILMSIVAALDLELYQMNAKIAFLNGDLKEEVFMQ